MGDVYEDLGIEISSDELFDMIQGSNLHPIIQQLFRNPETGQVDRNAVVRFLKSLEVGVAPEQRDYWLYLEKQIVEERTQSKYTNMIGKGLYVTGVEAQKSMLAKTKKVNFDYIALNYNSVSDSTVTVADKDLKAYFDAHQDDYKQEKLRQIEYVTYNVTPSKADYTEGENWINDIKADFGKATDDIQFVNSNSDVSFVGVWSKKEDLPENVGNWVFDENVEEGAVFEPYFENDLYTLSKEREIKMVPDSGSAPSYYN